MVTVCRFSENGFIPSVQTHLIHEIEYLLAENFSEIPEHLRRFVSLAAKEVNEQWMQQTVGYWVFIGSVDQLEQETARFQLNHLNPVDKAKRSWHQTELPDDVLAYFSHKVLKGCPQPLSQFCEGDAVYIFQQV